jgi:phage terminase Nu1 subunit (DNA packaging protein)
MKSRRLKPVYWENQKQCAAALSLDVRELKEWKAEGCPAFRYSRIYHAELLDWIKKKKKDIRAAESAAEPEQTDPPRSHWDRERARVEYERAKFNLEIEKRKYVELDEILAAVGQMLAGFMSAMRMFPGSAARWLVGLREFHQIKAKLEAEVDTILASLNRCKYLEDMAPALIEKLFSDRTPEWRQDLAKYHAQLMTELGRECFRELQIDLDDASAKNDTRVASSV